MSATLGSTVVTCPACNEAITVSVALSSDDVTALQQGARVRVTADRSPVLDHVRERHPDLLDSPTPVDPATLAGGGQLPNE